MNGVVWFEIIPQFSYGRRHRHWVSSWPGNCYITSPGRRGRTRDASRGLRGTPSACCWSRFVSRLRWNPFRSRRRCRCRSTTTRRADRPPAQRIACQGRLWTTVFYPRRCRGETTASFSPASADPRLSHRRRCVFRDRLGSDASRDRRETTSVVCRGHRGIGCATAAVCRPADAATVHRRRRRRRACRGPVGSRACCLRRLSIASRCSPSWRRRQPGRVVLPPPPRPWTERRRQRQAEPTV